MPDLSTLPPELRPLISRYQLQVRELMADLENGRITPRLWRDGMRRLLARYHASSLLAGLGDAEVGAAASSTAVDMLERTVQRQWDWLENFYTVVAASEFNPAWVTRALMYTLSPKTSYWEGRVYRDVGRFLPLPAMPAQGTSCLTNCGCAWRVETIDAEAGDYDAYWERSLDDSCQTCLQREEEWSPLRIRDGRLLT